MFSGFLGVLGVVRAQSANISGIALAAPASGDDAPYLDFDIPALPLNAALNRYADTTGQPALFPSDLTAGRTSSAIRGRYSAEVALSALLEGTGLSIDKLDSVLGQTFVLKAAERRVVVQQNGMTELFREDGYPGLIQRRIWQALCANSYTTPGKYTALLRFYLDAGGHVNGARLLGSSGNRERDVALLEVLRMVRIDRAPPPVLTRQPLTITVSPGDPVSGSQCRHAKSEF